MPEPPVLADFVIRWGASTIIATSNSAPIVGSDFGTQQNSSRFTLTGEIFTEQFTTHTINLASIAGWSMANAFVVLGDDVFRFNFHPIIEENTGIRAISFALTQIDPSGNTATWTLNLSGSQAFPADQLRLIARTVC